MNCPHCQKPLPENYSASFCPHCGGAVEYPQSPVPVAPLLPPVKINWFLFFAVFLAPPLLTLLSAIVNKGHSNEGVSPPTAILGGAAAGITCGVLLALRLGRTKPTRVALGILFA